MHRFTARYVDALAFAAELHQDQRRKHADVPYVSHLLAVSALVWEDGGRAFKGVRTFTLTRRDDGSTDVTDCC